MPGKPGLVEGKDLVVREQIFGVVTDAREAGRGRGAVKGEAGGDEQEEGEGKPVHGRGEMWCVVLVVTDIGEENRRHK